MVIGELLAMAGEVNKRRNETAEQRKPRLAAELRANLLKRKAKARSLSQEETADIATVLGDHEGRKQD